jgi:hypothetical protein
VFTFVWCSHHSMALTHMNFIQMCDAKEEGKNWEMETVMKEDGATKMSEDKG